MPYFYLKLDEVRPPYSKLLLNKTTIKLMCDGAPSIYLLKIGTKCANFYF